MIKQKMSVTPIIFHIAEKAIFQDTAKAHALIVGNIFLKDLSYKEVKIERLSFLNYAEQTFYWTFPFNTPLSIHNLGAETQFGFGNYSGCFFEVIATIDDNKPKNFRIFYEIMGPKPTLAERLAVAAKVSGEMPPPVPPTLPQTNSIEESAPTDEPTTSDTVFVLGENRKCIKKGRGTYVMYEGKQISLTEAKKLEKTKKI